MQAEQAPGALLPSWMQLQILCFHFFINKRKKCVDVLLLVFVKRSNILRNGNCPHILHFRFYKPTPCLEPWFAFPAGNHARISVSYAVNLSGPKGYILDFINLIELFQVKVNQQWLAAFYRMGSALCQKYHGKGLAHRSKKSVTLYSLAIL